MSNSRLLLAIVTLCSACGGSSFEAGGSGGVGGTSAEAGATGSHGGDTSSAGTSNGGSGAESSAGASGHAAGGAATAGAGGASAGGTSSGGTSAGGTSAGGASAGAGTGGSHAGGSSGGASAGAGGSGGASDCTTLKAEYTAALAKARVCDAGSMDQCDKSSTLPTLGCGCPTLVNAKSEATTIAKQKYQAFQNAKCPIGPICAIACIAYTSAACTAQAMGGGFVCTGSNAGIAN